MAADGCVSLMRLRWGCSIGLLWLSLASGVPTAAAEARGLGLNWVRLEGAEQCISAAELMNRVETSVGRILFVRSGDSSLSIDGYVAASKEPQGWAVRLALSTPQGEVLGARDLGVFPGAECSVIDKAVEFLLHVTLDADGTLDMGIPLSDTARRVIDDAIGGVSSDPDPAQLPIANVTAQPRPVAQPTEHATAKKFSEPPAQEPTSSTRFTLSAAGEAGQLPGVGLGVLVHATQVVRNGWSLGLGVSSWPSRSAITKQGRADIDLLAGSMLICPPAFFSVLTLCAGAEYGRMSATPSGFKFSAAPSSHSAFEVLGTGVFWIELWSPLLVRTALTVAVPLVRNDYVFTTFADTERRERLFRTAPVVGRIEIGLGLRL